MNAPGPVHNLVAAIPTAEAAPPSTWAAVRGIRPRCSWRVIPRRPSPGSTRQKIWSVRRGATAGRGVQTRGHRDLARPRPMGRDRRERRAALGAGTCGALAAIGGRPVIRRQPGGPDAGQPGGTESCADAGGCERRSVGRETGRRKASARPSRRLPGTTACCGPGAAGGRLAHDLSSSTCRYRCGRRMVQGFRPPSLPLRPSKRRNRQNTCCDIERRWQRPIPSSRTGRCCYPSPACSSWPRAERRRVTGEAPRPARLAAGSGPGPDRRPATAASRRSPAPAARARRRSRTPPWRPRRTSIRTPC